MEGEVECSVRQASVGGSWWAAGLVPSCKPWAMLLECARQTPLPCPHSRPQMNLEDNCEAGPDGNCKIVVS